MTHYTRSFRPWMLVLILSLIYLSTILVIHHGDAKAFVTLGDCFKQCTGESCDEDADEGYDGQFAYYIARDPAGSVDCLDVPSYRMQRILLPTLGRLLSLSTVSLIPWAFVAINLTALVISTVLLEDLLAAERVSRVFALSYGLFAGVFMAVRLSTTEALAYGLVIAAIWAEQRNRLWTAAVLLGMAGLAKETTGLFAAGYLLYYGLHRHWRDAIRLSLIAGLPFVIWQITLVIWLGKPGLGSGGALATPFELLPFAGVIRIATDGGLLVFLLLGALIIPIAILPSLWALWRTIRDLRRHKWELYSCLLLANAAIMPFVPFSTYREFLGLFRFIPGLVIMVVLYAARHKQRRPLVYSTLWIVLLLFTISG